jgi:hypothetical protein
MTDQELRAIVRDAVQRHLAQQPAAAAESNSRVASGPALTTPAPARAAPSPTGHPSHFLYRLVNVGEACVIEPGVGCNHCGYCKTHGH